MAILAIVRAAVVKINIVPPGRRMAIGACAGIVCARARMALFAIVQSRMVNVNRSPTIYIVAGTALSRIMGRRPVGVAALTFIGNRVIKIYVVPTIGIMAGRTLTIIVV